MKQIWMSIYDEGKEAEITWSVLVDLDKPMKFKKLQNGRIGFTQNTKRWWQFWRKENQ